MIDMGILRNKIANWIYIPSLLILISVMITLIVVSLYVIYWSSGFSSQFVDQPIWLVDFSLPILKAADSLSSSETNDSFKAFGALTLLISGMVMGTFLRRTKDEKARFEHYLVLTFLLLAISQVICLVWLPNPLKAGINLTNGEEIAGHLTSLLTRYSGIATALCGAALGFGTSENNDEGGDQ